MYSCMLQQKYLADQLKVCSRVGTESIFWNLKNILVSPHGNNYSEMSFKSNLYEGGTIVVNFEVS